MAALGILGVWLALGISMLTVTTLWTRRLWRRRAELTHRTRIVAAFVAATALFGAVGTIAGLLKAFGALDGQNVDPSQKARILAEGISEAMNCSAVGLIAWVPSVVTLLVVTRKRKKDGSHRENHVLSRERRRRRT